MKKEEVLESVSHKKALVGEMEKQKMNKGFLVSILAAGIVAVVLIVTEFTLGHFTGGFAIAAICYLWASIQYFCQFFMAHRPWQVLIGAVLEALAAIACFVFYILFCVGVF